MNTRKWIFPLLLLYLMQCTSPAHFRTILQKKTEERQALLLPVYNPYDIPDIRKYRHLFTTSGYWTPEVEAFYQMRDYKPAWFTNGRLSPNAFDLIHEVALSDLNGIPGSRYNIIQIYSGIKKLRSSADYYLKFPSLFVNLDVLLTSTFLEYAHDLHYGYLDPAGYQGDQKGNSRTDKLNGYLNRAVETGSVVETLNKLQPDHVQYRKLRQQLWNLLELKKNGDYPNLSYMPFLSENDTNINVLKLKKFLRTTGDLTNENEEYLNSPVFDDEMTVAVKLFQFRNGLKPDGTLNEPTLGHMNMLLEDRIDIVRINMDRIRRLPTELGKRYMMINLPDFSLTYLENDTLKINMKIMPGHPVSGMIGDDTLKYLILKPLSRFSGPKSKKPAREAAEINISSASDNSHSGKKMNSAGQIFIKAVANDRDSLSAIFHSPGSAKDTTLMNASVLYPRKNSLYLMNIPDESMFRNQEEVVDAGSFVLEKPYKLAELLLTNDVTQAEILNEHIGDLTDTLYLRDPVLIHVVYRTAWVDDLENIHYRDDIFGLDEKSIQLLKNERNMTLVQ